MQNASSDNEKTLGPRTVRDSEHTLTSSATGSIVPSNRKWSLTNPIGFSKAYTEGGEEVWVWSRDSFKSDRILLYLSDDSPTEEK